jgi:hypothetical protein
MRARNPVKPWRRKLRRIFPGLSLGYIHVSGW